MPMKFTAKHRSEQGSDVPSAAAPLKVAVAQAFVIGGTMAAAL